jgi:hypothetical protein
LKNPAKRTFATEKNDYNRQFSFDLVAFFRDIFLLILLRIADFFGRTSKSRVSFLF